MGAQSLLGKIGFRAGILGTTASLAIAAPLASGDYSQAAHTDASRIGWYFDRTAADEAVVTNVMGVDIQRVSVKAITSAVIGIFPAATAGASGYASIRLPHGTAPTTNITDGDMWSTTSGFFTRENAASYRLIKELPAAPVVSGAVVYGAGGVNALVTSSSSWSFSPVAANNEVFLISNSTTTAAIGRGTQMTFNPASGLGQKTAVKNFADVQPSGNTSATFIATWNRAVGGGAISTRLGGATLKGTYIEHGLSISGGANGAALGIGIGLDILGTYDIANAGAEVSTLAAIIGIQTQLSATRTGGTSFTVDDYYGLLLQAPSLTNVTVTRAWGVYQNGATVRNYFAGSVVIDGTLGGYLGDVVLEVGTTRTLSSLDQGRIIRFTSNSAIAVTMPDSLPAGFSCVMYTQGTGQITVGTTGGGQLFNRQSQFKSAGQYAAMTLAVLANAGSAAIGILAGDTAA